MDMQRRGEWDPIMKGELIHDIHKDGDMQLDLVWMGSATLSGAGAMDLALLRCCQRIDDSRFAIVSRRFYHVLITSSKHYILPPNLHPSAS
jgi:hypothetical protein